jgi:hypothetical protein
MSDLPKMGIGQPLGGLDARKIRWEKAIPLGWWRNAHLAAKDPRAFTDALGRFSGLENEAGPEREVTLQWAAYFDAADQARLSRLYGGIHVPTDDFTHRKMGSDIDRGVTGRPGESMRGVRCPID